MAKESAVGFYDVETLHGFKGEIGLIGFKYQNSGYHPFTTTGDFYRFLRNESMTKKLTLYGFNSSRFDFLKVLDEAFAYGGRLEIMDIKFSGSLPFSITIRLPETRTVVRFKDLRGVLRQGSLNSLSKDILGIEKVKDIDIRDVSEITPEIVEYNKRDIELTQKLYEYIVNFFGSDKVSTAPGMSMRMFEESYGKENVERKINRRGTRISYYGGRTEVFKRMTLEPFKYYDINSLYPYCMANFPFPVGEVYYDSKNIKKEGFSVANVTVPDTYIPFVPFKCSGKLLFPYGKMSGVWTNMELRKMVSLGYDVSVIASYVCDETEYIFADFINKIYAKRKKAKKDGNKAVDSFCKLVMNSLYGKFGKKREIEVVRLKALNEIQETTPFINKMFYNNQLYFWTVKKIMPKSIYYDYITSSYITAYGRSTLFDFMLKANPHNLIYSDTDSLMVFGDALDNYVSGELGGLKVEHVCSKGVFMAPKMYALTVEEGKKEIKAKGLPLPEPKKEEWMSDAEFAERIRERERICGSIETLSPFSMKKTRIYGIKESMRRHKNSFFNLEEDVTKRVTASYDKRVILEDGIETEPMKVESGFEELRAKMDTDVFFSNRALCDWS